MKRFTSILLLMILGCASPHTQSSDFVPSFFAKLQNYGAKIPKMTGLPQIQTTWKITGDRNGFVAELPPERFQDIKDLLRRLYGAPSLWEPSNLDGNPQGVYGAKQAGAAIQFIRTREQTQVICIRSARTE